MSIPRVKPSGWASNEELSSAQMNLLDTQINARALDKQAGASETCASNVTFSGTNAYTGAGTVSGSGTFTMGSTKRVLLASRSITRAQEHFGSGQTANGYLHWYHNDGDQNGATGTTPNTLTSPLLMPLHIPDGATLTGVTVHVDPAGGHGALPATMPNFTVYKRVMSTGVESSLGGPYTDSSGSVGVYEAVHPIASGALSEVIARQTTRYFAVLFPESSTDSRSGMVVLGWTVTYTTTSYDED